MRRRHLSWLVLLLAVAVSASAQSLGELAKKEKERRRKNKDEGVQVHVVTEAELPEGKAIETSTEQGAPPSSSPRSGPGQTTGEVLEGETPVPADIPREGSLQDKLRVFEDMVKAYRAEAQAIDEEVAKNNARLSEIEQQLISIGASGLPTAPQADRGVRYEGDYVALQAEQQQLRLKNQQLQAQKVLMADDLRNKARRAGIPPGYLRF